jgi:transcriptional regulator with XRE-family HTH domain
MDAELAKTIGNAARKRRQSLGLTQEDVAERLGVTVEFYGRIERGRTLPSTPTLVALSKSLDLSADTLLGRPVSGGRWGVPTKTDQDPPELRRLVRRLRRAPTSLLRVLTVVATEFEKARRSRSSRHERGS